VFLGTIGVPTIALMLLIGLPFLDRRRERRLSARPVAMVAAVLTILSMAILTWKGATAKEALASEVIQDVPSWVKAENLPAGALPGAKLFASAGCTACHTYNGSGGSNLGAPDLTDIGSRNLGIQFQINHLKCPSCVNPGSPMPKFASLGEKRLHQLAVFLEASKGKP
jgi:mono/diheme cytochrome c family protein